MDNNGNYEKNPFDFQHNNLTQIGISVNGEEVPFKPLKLNFDEELFVTVYNTFQHNNLIQIGILVNGEEVPFKPLKFNFDDNLFVTAYSTLFSGTGKLYGNSGSIIKREDYSEGYTVIVADLTPFEIGDNFDLKAEGTLRIDLVFKSLLAAAINVLVYAE